MSDHISIERMHEAVDGILTAAEMSSLEGHLDGCSACRHDFARISEVVTALRTLPRSAAAPNDAWLGIEKRIVDADRDASASEHDEAKVLELPTRSEGEAEEEVPFRGRRFTLTVQQLAAAALFVALVSAATVWIALDATPPSVGPQFAEDVPGGAAARAVSLEGNRYLEVVDELQQILDQGRSVLAPETLVMIEESLSTVDAAIAEIEAALADDPNSDLLLRMLATHQRTKLGVLQRAAAAVQAQV